ncbi:MAG: flavoredoxin [Candidatus Brocadia sp.]|uniref:Flavoredoxin n=1 Tax=Candidatus Brocadia fulgida TaxID=380242 RepID=A0A0M2UWF8_9BACT|nr:MAG: flavoredoxin [Candidatus Brocadia fulgida]MCC6325201.1 flavin reductase family protein [Candidatus Brocadia sp.]MCE7910670.1 flavin reductase family protein [Candidatus Brocadia sp. AMX3]MBV6518867.1 Flavoredoxin [Candidatus Brocadia fulgida]MDG5996038.1 flavin reductase family protein [Candidatus Brocadia sp.]
MKKSLGQKTIVYPTPVLIVGTYDKAGKPNAMNVAWGGLCCSSPPSIAISIRKATYTYGNLVERKAFTVNIPSESYAKEADYFGIASGGKEDKFSATGLTPERSSLVDAPYIKEFPLVLECKLTYTIEIGLHTQFIGEIMDVKVEESALGESGIIDMEKLHPILYAPEIRAYYGVGKPLGKAFSIGKQVKVS